MAGEKGSMQSSADGARPYMFCNKIRPSDVRGIRSVYGLITGHYSTKPGRSAYALVELLCTSALVFIGK